VAAALDAHPIDAPLLLDFDETLWLRNSTEAFLDWARPRWLVAILLRLIRLSRIWRLAPGSDADHCYRDWLRVLLVVVLTPWNLPRWQHHAAAAAVPHVNRQLVAALEARGLTAPLVVTNGFRCIVAPMLTAFAPLRPRLLAAPLLGAPAWRRRGKLAVVTAELGTAAVGRATLVTASQDDAGLLAATAQGIHVRWPEARYEPAGERGYVPFDYLERGKRPGRRHFLRAVLGEELVVVWLAYAVASPEPLLAALALFFLHLSFWAVYEIGYVENDRVAERLEAAPRVPDGYHARAQAFDPRLAWGCALILAAIGLMPLVLGSPSGDALRALWPSASPPGLMLAALGAWSLVLIGTRALFRLYNLTNKPGRTMLYLPLQACKVLGFAVLLPLSTAGAILVIAHITARWIPYLVYRYGNTTPAWHVPDRLIRLILVAAGLLALFALEERPDDRFLLGAGLILAWCALKARGDIGRLAAKVGPVRDERPPS
jgi:hypothetical protein